MARRDPYAAVDAFFAAIAPYPELRPYSVTAVAVCDSEQRGYVGAEELDRAFFFGERVCHASVTGHGRVGAWRSRVETALASGGYSPRTRDASSFEYTRYLIDGTDHAEELEYLANLGNRGDSLPSLRRAPTEIARIEPPAERYWQTVQQVRHSSFQPTEWRCGAMWKSPVAGVSGQTHWVITSPMHAGWAEASVFVQVLTDDGGALSSAVRTTVRRALAAKRYTSLRSPPSAPHSATLFLRDASSASGAVREAVRVHEHLMALCAAL